MAFCFCEDCLAHHRMSAEHIDRTPAEIEVAVRARHALRRLPAKYSVSLKAALDARAPAHEIAAHYTAARTQAKLPESDRAMPAALARLRTGAKS